MTNTVALVFSTLGSTLGSRPELEGQAARLRPLAVAAVLGGATGATLLLLTPSDTFERIAPWLIGVASLAILVRPRVASRAPPPPRRAAGLIAGVFLIAIYGGYFGAAAGVMVLALMLVATGESLARSNAFKNVVLGIANATAAVGFALLGPVALGRRRARSRSACSPAAGSGRSSCGAPTPPSCARSSASPASRWRSSSASTPTAEGVRCERS